MDFTSSVEYLAAIIVIVLAGASLGMALSRRRVSPEVPMLHERLKAYTDLLGTVDGLRDAEAGQKRRFIKTYQKALMYAPDPVIRALDHFVQSAAAENYDPAAAMEARDAAVLAMRRDALTATGRTTSIKAVELLSIEIDGSRAQTVAHPAAPVAPPAPANQEELA